MDLTHGSTSESASSTALVREMDMLSGQTHILTYILTHTHTRLHATLANGKRHCNLLKLKHIFSSQVSTY